MIRRLTIGLIVLTVFTILMRMMLPDKCDASFEKPLIVRFESPGSTTMGFTIPIENYDTIGKPNVKIFDRLAQAPLSLFKKPSWTLLRPFEKLSPDKLDRPNLGTQRQTIENISPQEAYVLIQNNKENPDFFIADIRTLTEYASGHIENSINIDFYSETFRDELDQLDKDRTYLIYCRTGRRTGIALGIMEELGFKKVYNMLGGITQWEAIGLPIIR